MHRLLRILLTLCAALALLATACGDDATSDGTPAAEGLVRGDALALRVVLPETAGVALETGAADLVAAAARVTGVDEPVDAVVRGDVEVSPAVRVELVADAAAGCPNDGYALTREGDDIFVRAGNEVAAMYGLYALVADLGVRHHHPEESVAPASDPANTFAGSYDGTASCPAFERRGFHEHTQHPIIASQALLEGDDQYRDEVSRYLRWYARNRQNVLSWHLLKTVDLDTWLPWIADVVAEAQALGIEVGMVVSFVDQQQNNFAILRDDRVGDDGERMPDDAQIDLVLTQLASAGFDFLTVQIGSTEFTKPEDDDVLAWLETAAEVLAREGVALDAWIHTTCDLEADDGSRFFHLPGRSSERVGAWVHTVMFHNLFDPAPVYGCEAFDWQLDFIDEQAGQRRLTYFPETAWWLGFDNNLPLALPLTGRSRHRDIAALADNPDVSGHVTFTTGREWGYWMYDHHLTRATWDASVDWDAYLAWMAPAFGDRADTVRGALSQLALEQDALFFDENPLLYFYLAGELPQDEVGAQVGVLARRPKPAYIDILALDAAAFEAWEQGELARLQTLAADRRDAFDAFESELGPRTEAPTPDALTRIALVEEQVAVLDLYALRAEHTATLYEAVAILHRGGWDDPDGGDDASLDDARALLDDARAMSARALDVIREQESNYRYPLDRLTAPRPSSLTAYPFGYLEETHRAYFWTRRDDQLDALLARLDDDAPQEWASDPGVVVYIDKTTTSLVVPDDPVAGSVITNFVPRYLIATGMADGDEAAVVFAEDIDGNDQPDAASLQTFSGQRDGDRFDGALAGFSLSAYDASGALYGSLTVLDARLELAFDGDTPTTGALEGIVAAEQLVELVTDVGGIDDEGVTNLLRGFFDVPEGEPLPEDLPFRFEFEPTPLEAP